MSINDLTTIIDKAILMESSQKIYVVHGNDYSNGDKAGQERMNDAALHVATNTTDPLIEFTIFPDKVARSKTEKKGRWSQLVTQLLNPKERASKEECPWIKLATFSDEFNPKSTSPFPSLRYDASVGQVFGLEGDYDAEKVSPTEAARLLGDAGIEALVITTASHTPEAPRWRLLAPLSKAHAPEERSRLLARVNGVLGGVLAGESFTLSQAYYFGKVAGKEFEVHHVKGRCVDLLNALPEVYKGGADAEPKAFECDDEKYQVATRHTLWNESFEEAQARFEQLLDSHPRLSALWSGNQSSLTGKGDTGSQFDWAVVGVLKLERFSLDNVKLLLEGFAHGSEKDRASDEKYDRAMERSFARHPNIARAPLGTASEDDFETLDDPEPDEMAGGAQDKSYLGPLEAMTFGNFLDAPPPPRRFIIEGFMPLGVTAVLAAAGGTGKSQFALQMAFAVATGGTCCGWQVEEQGASLLVMAEDEREENGRRAHHAFSEMTAEDTPAEAGRKRAAILKNVRPVSLVGRDAGLIHQDKKSGWVPNVEAIKDLIAKAKAIPDLKLIVLDPASRFRAGDENDNQGATLFVRVAERILKATGATVIVTAHVNKTSTRSGAEGSSADVRGASGLVDGVRMALIMREMSKDEAISLKVSDKDRRDYVRVDTGKFNYGKPVRDAWLKRGERGYLAAHTFEKAASKAEIEEDAQAAHDEADYARQMRILNILHQNARPSEHAEKGTFYSEREFRLTFGDAYGPLRMSDKPLRGVLGRMKAKGWLVQMQDPSKAHRRDVLVLAAGPSAPRLDDDLSQDGSDLI